MEIKEGWAITSSKEWIFKGQLRVGKSGYLRVTAPVCKLSHPRVQKGEAGLAIEMSDHCCT